jgi:hypothetical protein
MLKEKWMHPLKDLASDLGIYKSHEFSGDKRLVLANGKKILFRSLEVPDKGVRSLDIYRLVIDEWTYCDKYACEVAEARLVLAESRSWKIATPNGTTSWVYNDHFGPDAKKHPNTEYLQFTTDNNPSLPKDFKEVKMGEMDILMYRQEVLAEWVNLCDTKIYYSFDMQRNVRPCQPPRDADGRIVEMVHVGLDYNVGIMANPHAWVDYRTNTIYVFDEGYGDKTTKDVGDRLKNTYGHTVHICDDASGNSRQQSDGKTQRQLLNQIGLFNVTGNISNPPIQKRQGLVNAYLCNGLGRAHLVIDPKCRRLIHELDNLTRKPNSLDTDTQGGKVGHITDALGYLVYNISGGRAAWDMQKAA